MFHRMTHSPIGIDIDGARIGAVQLRRRSGRNAAWSINAATSLHRSGHGSVPDTAEIVRLRDVLHRQGFVGNRVILALPHEHVLAGEIEVPPASSNAPVEQIARIELARMHKCDPQTLEISYWFLPPRARSGEPSDVMAVACQVGASAPLLDAFESHGLEVCALDVQCGGVARACQTLLKQSGKAAAILNLRWDGVDLVICQHDRIVHHRRLADAGMQRLLERMMSQFELSAEMAGFVMSMHGPQGSDAGAMASPLIVKQVQGAFDAHLEGMVDEIQPSCSYVLHRYADAAPKELLLMGPGASIPYAAEVLGRSLGMTTRVVNSADMIECSPSLRDSCGTSALTMAIGLAQHREAA